MSRNVDLVSKDRRPSAAYQHIRAIHALSLRDFKTRAGATYFGLLFGLAVPLAHIAIVLAVYILLGRRAPIGTDVTIFLTSAVLPFVVWSYTHQRMMRCLADNQPLLAFPTIRLVDITVSRAVSELLNSVVVVIVVWVALSISKVDIFLSDIHGAIFVIMLAYMYGVSTGLIFSAGVIYFPFTAIIGYLLIPVNWMISGVFFVPDALPTKISEVVSYFPLAHIVDMGRSSVYSEYISDFANFYFIVAAIFLNVIAFFIINSMLRTKLAA